MSPFSLRVLRPLSVFFALLLTAMVPFGAVAQSKTIVISQIYGAGGNSSVSSYDSDFVELFNLSSAPVNIGGWSIQYIAAGSTSVSTQITPIAAGTTLQPGQFYLIKEATGSTCTTKTTPACPTITGDNATQGSINLSGTAGKVFLVNSSTTITEATATAGATTTCPATPPAGGAIIDYVGFGSTASCTEGAKNMAALSANNQSAIRTVPCTDTDVTGNDFSVSSPVVARNTSTTLAPCTTASPSNPSLTVAVSPTSQNSGSAVLVTAVLTAGVPAASTTSITVDLSAIGGSKTQPLYDDGSNGDVKSGDGTYSYNFTIPASQASVTNATLTFSLTDSSNRTATGMAMISVTKPVAFMPIHTIQGSMGTGMTAPAGSTYIGQVVQTSGIVTGVLTNGYYIQARDAVADADPTTPEGIFIHTGTGSVPSTATVGTEVQVSGTATLYPSGYSLAGTELDSVTGYSVLSTANALPAAIPLTTSFPSPSGGPFQLMRLQSMRVSVAPSFTATEGTQGTQPSEAAEVYVSNGQFYGTVTGVPRPIREAGLEILDPLTASYPAIAKFDDNPELFAVDSLDMQGGAAGPIDLATGAVLTNMVGVMDFSGSEYSLGGGSGPQLGAGPVFMVDATSRPVVTGGMTVVAVPAANAGELTIGDQNMERFYDVNKETTGAVALTPAAYALRLAKGSLAIRNVLKTPDILALEEMENIQTMNDLSAQISSDAIAAGQTDPTYVPYLVQGNDSSGINVAFLVNPAKVDVLNAVQYGKTNLYAPTGLALNDRPPLVLHVGIKRAIPAEYPLTIIVNHLRSLNGVTANTTSGSNVRGKREQQAEFLANLIQTFQANGEHVVSVGDYNAFDVNDGIVDSMDIIEGKPTSAGADIVAGPTTPLVTPALVDAAPTNVPNGAYSYVYVGDAQSIDHFLVTADIASITRTAPAHFDADFPVVFRNDSTRPEVSSDHDGIVGYISIPPGTFISVTPASLSYAVSQPLNTPSASQPVTVKNTGTAAITFTSITPSAGFTQTNSCGTSLAGGASCIVNVTFQPVVTGPTTGTLTLTDSDQTGTQTVQLSGTGAGIYSTILLSVSPSYAVAGANVALTATLGGNSTNLPAGTVTFFDNGNPLNTVNVVNGTATLNTTTLAVGNHPITATYNGSSVYPTATTGAAVVVTIAAAPVADFSFSVSNATINVSDALPSGSATLNVAFLNGFSQAVSFSCAGLPSNAHCSFAPATLTASGTSKLTVVIDKAAVEPAGINPLERNGGIALGLGLLGLTLARRRKALRGVMLGALLLGVLATTITGCGSGTTTNKGSSTVVITASAGSVSHTASFTLNVQ